jgi:PmbA protein
MNVDGLIDTILTKAAAAGAGSAEVFYDASESRPVQFEDNRVKYIATKSERGVGLRIIKDGRIGFSSTSDLGRIDELAANALESAKFGQEARFEFPATCEAAAVQVYDDRVPAFSTREMAELGQEAINRVLARHPDVQCSAEIAASIGEEEVANTNGLSVGHRSTSFSMHITVLAVDDDGLLWVGDGKTGSNLLTDTTAFTDKVVRDLDLAQSEASVSTGAVTAVFTPDAMSTLLLTLSQGVNGKLVQKGASPLTDRLGEQVLDERISIFDDGLVDFAASSAPHDTEGLPSARTPLFENGVLRNYLLDLQTAGVLGCRPTGNGLRDYSTQPGPGDNNTMVAPGDTSFDDMLAGIKHGLLVDSVLGGGMGNALAGDFSVNVALGFLIENGKLAGRAKNCMVFGNVYDLLCEGVAAVGDTPEMKGSMSMPHFCFKEVSIGSQ